jgi:hypothetical protein
MSVDQALQDELEAELTKYDPRHQDFEISKLDEMEELLRTEQTSTRRAIERKLEKVCDAIGDQCKEISSLHAGIKEASDLARASVVVDILCAMMIAGGLLGFGYMMSGGK